jgi:hypothetical protein
VSALQAGALISKLTEEKNSAIQQNHRLRQELVSEASYFIYAIVSQLYITNAVSSKIKDRELMPNDPPINA